MIWNEKKERCKICWDYDTRICIILASCRMGGAASIWNVIPLSRGWAKALSHRISLILLIL